MKLITTFFVAFIVVVCGLNVFPQRVSENIEEKVFVRRDERSILYVEAQNDPDLYFTQGFETARDRLWQMDLLRRVARGELAEIFGKTVLSQDKMWRRYGFSGVADESYKLMDSGLRNALDDYARGVNAYIATLDKETMPIEFKILSYSPKRWNPTDSIIIGKILAEGLSNTWWQDLQYVELEKLPKAKFEALTNVATPEDLILYGTDNVVKKSSTSNSEENSEVHAQANSEFIAKSRAIRKKSLERIGFYAKGLAASNNWVISGKLTADGKAILANDPHLRATAPGIWHMAHLSSKEMRVSGVTVPGIPGIVLGHNQNIAWGATNVGPDVQDLYYETFNSEGKYKTPTGWKSPLVRNEIILVRKDSFSRSKEQTKYDVTVTENGPIIRDDSNEKIALKWTATDPNNQEFEAFYFLNRAKNWRDFKNSLRRYGGATQNFVFADKKGNIGWHVAGKIPIRRKGTGIKPYKGDSTDGDWIGWIPFEELPHLYNPESGYIVTANQRIVGLDYKYQQITRQFAAPWRAIEITKQIEGTKGITVEDVMSMQYAMHNEPLKRLATEIVKRKAASGKILELVSNWNGESTADSKGMTVLNSIDACLGNEIATENAPASSYQLRTRILPWAIPNEDKLFLPSKYKNWSEFLQKCVGQADSALTKKFGSDTADWKWGKVRTTNFEHPLSSVPLIGARFKLQFTNVGGSGSSPNVGENVSMRFVAKPKNWDETRHVIPLGQSGSTDSGHWVDQFDAWQTGVSPVFPFSPNAVKRATVSETVWIPKD